MALNEKDLDTIMKGMTAIFGTASEELADVLTRYAEGKLQASRPEIELILFLIAVMSFTGQQKDKLLAAMKSIYAGRQTPVDIPLYVRSVLSAVQKEIEKNPGRKR